nr:MRE11 [Dactylobiotus sp.]
MTQSFSPPPSPSQSRSFSLDLNPSISMGSSRNRSQHRQLCGQPQGTQIDPEDTFSILIASDCHLGYADRDELRKMDSINSFEEVLHIAKDKGVDFVLLGGDLFHENKPSRFTAQRCAALLRNNCMGDGEIKFDLISDPEVNFAHIEENFRRVNTKDPDLNICLPVFSIHGNHDDPSGLKYLSELDLLHTYGLINYFGKVNDIGENYPKNASDCLQCAEYPVWVFREVLQNSRFPSLLLSAVARISLYILNFLLLKRHSNRRMFKKNSPRGKVRNNAPFNDLR